MNKKQLKEELQEGKTLLELFVFTKGDDCLIYKGEFEKSDEIIYIPDMEYYEVPIDKPLNPDEIERVLDYAATGYNFIDECNGNEKLAKELFYSCEWANIQIELLCLVECYGDDEFCQEFGMTLEEKMKLEKY